MLLQSYSSKTAAAIECNPRLMVIKHANKAVR